MAQFPQRRVQIGALWHGQAGQSRLENREGSQCVSAAGLQRQRQRVGIAATRQVSRLAAS